MFKYGEGASRLSKFSLGMAFGVVKGLFLLVLAWYVYWSGSSSSLISYMSELYHGYDASIMGGVIGAIWGFVVGFISGFFIGGVYNCFLCGCKCFCKSRVEK
jgi:uncharacterized membrane protein YfcA